MDNPVFPPIAVQDVAKCLFRHVGPLARDYPPDATTVFTVAPATRRTLGAIVQRSCARPDLQLERDAGTRAPGHPGGRPRGARGADNMGPPSVSRGGLR